MSSNPYKNMPNEAFWRRSIAAPEASDVDPVVKGKFKISKSDNVATAGSCFAQHIARHLSGAGFNYYVAETVHPRVAKYAQSYNYGTYSARYGNIYSPRQLLQLFRRAYGQFSPIEDTWKSLDGEIKDPFRPEIQPGGFSSLREFHTDRAQHFSAIQRMVENLDVFVFTLGLTEAWVSKKDGAVFPICPGVSGGIFDSGVHEFINFGVHEVVEDLEAAISFVRERNASAKFILTVSPVPLMATAEARSVLQSTVYSKSVLRVAAEIVSSKSECIAYFPSFEIVTGPHTRGRYFETDLRSVTDEGVSHVMKLFLKHYTDFSAEDAIDQAHRNVNLSDEHLAIMQKGAAIICEEELLDR